jgi:hypothetical protein
MAEGPPELPRDTPSLDGAREKENALESRSDHPVAPGGCKRMEMCMMIKPILNDCLWRDADRTFLDFRLDRISYTSIPDIIAACNQAACPFPKSRVL